MSGSDRSDKEYKIELEAESNEESEYCLKPQRIRKTRSLFEWDEDDEITLLKQLYQFSAGQSCKGDFYYSKEFYEYVKPRLRNKDVTMSELGTKIGLFKNQYLEFGRKLSKLKFSEPHQSQVCMLSKRIWGGYDGGTVTNHTKGFREFLEEVDIDVNCLKPSCLEYLQKDWEVQLLMYTQFLSKKSKFDAKLRELIMSANSHI